MSPFDEFEFERARARLGQVTLVHFRRSVCPCCMTMLVFAGREHVCPHGRSCFVFVHEDAYEWSCPVCRKAFDERERFWRVACVPASAALGRQNLGALR